MFYVSTLVFSCLISCVFASIEEEPKCLSRFDYEYKVVQKLVELEHKQKEQLKLIEHLTHQYETTKAERGAAFSAYLTKDLNKLSNLQVIVFNEVQTNVGDVYNEETGKFICKNSGVYVFYWVITNKDTTYMDSELVINDEQRSQAFSDAGNHNDYAVASNVVIAELNRGDEVWVRVGTSHDGFIAGAHRSSFSGWRLYSR